MSLGIYQLFFKEEHKQFLNPGFVPFDNISNKYPDQREYAPLFECWLRHEFDLWGAVPWNWNIKSNDLPPQDIITFIKRNPGYDAYTIDLYTNHSAMTYNVWEQGQWCHPHIITIAEELFPLMGLNKNLLYQPQDRGSMFWGSMVVANNKFWNQYFELSQSYIRAIERLSPHTKALFNSPASYTDNNISHFSFIQERLLSTFVHTKLDQLKVISYHLNEYKMEEPFLRLDKLKTLCMERKDPALFYHWCDVRTPVKEKYYPSTKDWAREWIRKYDISFAPK